jgi:hypothetical protein
MVQSIDSLINQLVPIKSLDVTGSPLLKPQVIEAIVLSSTDLTKSITNKAESSFQVTLSTGKQQYQISSEIPLPEGTKLLLKITQDNSALLLKILQQPAAQNLSGKTSPQQTPVTSPQIKTLETHMRQALPSQQAIKLLLPLLQNSLQQLSQQTPSRQARGISHSIQQLVKLFPSAEALQQPRNLKQAIHNSGVFLEAKLAKSVQHAATRTNPTTRKATAPLPGNVNLSANNTPTKTKNNVAISGDLKSQLQKLSQQVDKALQPANEKPASARKVTSPLPNINNTAAVNDPKKEAINIAPELQLKQENFIKDAKTSSAPKENLDIVLRQLGKQLLASLARTQLNQLESLSTRAQFNTDNQGPTNSWVLEIPITHGKHIDNLELLITEEELNDKDSDKEKVWSVMLNFDLHAMGKMSVQLKIVKQSVAATIWSQLQHTHTMVSKQVNELQENLEAIGVNVKTVDCYLGKPPEHLNTIHRQLVDVHT